MANVRQLTRYVCQNCGAEFPKWQGKCDQCQQWNTLVETIVSQQVKSSRLRQGFGGQAKLKGQNIKPIKLSEVKSQSFNRIKTGISELDRVLGGGVVPGSVVLIAGEPGIGKSTLLTQLALSLIGSSLRSATKFDPVFESRAKKLRQPSLSHRRDAINAKTLSNLLPRRELSWQSSVLYVCGEESPNQIKLRIERLLIHNQSTINQQSINSNFSFLPETNLENILATMEQLVTKKLKDQNLANYLIIIDSIQTIWSENLTGTAGSVGQVRECSNMLLNFAKKTNIPIFLIGHITKEGAIAGPKVLEHLVDTVLYLEGDSQHDFRILRATKNRFGSTDEVGIFQLTDRGMEEVSDPSKLFLSPPAKALAGGKAVTVSLQGVRPMLVEIQALVVPTQLPIPRRIASGISYQKLQVLCAVLQKRLGLPLYQSDVFVNVAGGLKLTEPAADLAICLSIASSFKNKTLADKAVCLGEVGLLGEIRKVSMMEKRIKEAKRLGYNLIIGDKESSLGQTVKYLK